MYDEKGFIGFSVFNYSDYRIYITNNLKNYDIWGLDIINSKPEYKGYREIPKYYLNMNYLDKYQGVVLGRMADKIISFNYLVGFQSLKEIDFIKFSLKNGIDFVNVDFIACNTKVRSIYGKLPSIDVNRFTRKTLTFINEIELSKQRDRIRLKIQVERQKAINEAVTLTNSEFKYLNTSIPKNEKQRQKQIDDRKNWFFISELMYNFDEIMKNELDFLKKDKKTMFQINRPIDSTNLRKELLNFDPSPCIEIICKNIVKEALKIVDCNISREKKIE